jgi:hypothetical protein
MLELRLKIEIAEPENDLVDGCVLLGLCEGVKVDGAQDVVQKIVLKICIPGIRPVEIPRSLNDGAPIGGLESRISALLKQKSADTTLAVEEGFVQDRPARVVNVVYGCSPLVE